MFDTSVHVSEPIIRIVTPLGSEPRLWTKQEPESESLNEIISTDMNESRHWI